MNDQEPITSKLLTANIKSAGCAAKVGSAELRQLLSQVPITTSPNLLAGIDNFEDAAVYKITDDVAIIQTIDFFPPVVDDPFLYGAIAATNALSDVYAMGGRPVLALNVLCFPTCDFPAEVVLNILKGGASQVQAAGAVLAGGHTIQTPDPVYGLAVMGLIDPCRMLTNGGAKPGDALVVSKAIGTGVGLLGNKAGLLSAAAQQVLIDSMLTLNEKALTEARNFSLNAATDITGFGLIGHLHQMASASGVSAVVQAAAVPLLPEVKELAEQGFVPAGAYGNRKSYESFTTYIDDLDLPISDLLFDPQTSGGLLFSLPAPEADSLVAALAKQGLRAARIGQFVEGQAGEVRLQSK